MKNYLIPMFLRDYKVFCKWKMHVFEGILSLYVLLNNYLKNKYYFL